jgi:beta-RFAP synthase
MIRVRTGSRLHFGFFDLPADNAWTGLDGESLLPRLPWGGVGMMLEEPGLSLTAHAAPEWSASGPSSQRALDYAKTISRHLRTGPVEIVVENCSHEHAGLGTGTQLALAVGTAIGRLRDATLFPWDMARMLGRGARSCLGIHGFRHGGLLVEAPHKEDALAPLVARHSFPEDWPIALVIPRGMLGTHGAQETTAFQSLRQRRAAASQTEALSRLVLLHMLPALAARDLDTFGDALFDFNRRVGDMFRPWQGGLYSHVRIAQTIHALRQAGFRAVGQSSWGPTIFAIGEPSIARKIAESLSADVVVTKARNQPALVAQIASSP